MRATILANYSIFSIPSQYYKLLLFQITDSYPANYPFTDCSDKFTGARSGLRSHFLSRKPVQDSGHDRRAGISPHPGVNAINNHCPFYQYFRRSKNSTLVVHKKIRKNDENDCIFSIIFLIFF